MYDYIQGLMKKIPERYMNNTGATSAPDLLYVVHDQNSNRVGVFDAKQK